MLQFAGSFIYAFYFYFHNNPVSSLLLFSCFMAFGHYALSVTGFKRQSSV